MAAPWRVLLNQFLDLRHLPEGQCTALHANDFIKVHIAPECPKERCKSRTKCGCPLARIFHTLSAATCCEPVWLRWPWIPRRTVCSHTARLGIASAALPDGLSPRLATKVYEISGLGLGNYILSPVLLINWAPNLRDIGLKPGLRTPALRRGAFWAGSMRLDQKSR